MNNVLKEALFGIALEKIQGDPSHDFEHIRRVTNLAEKIGESVQADLEVVIPAALFHDIVVYAKDDPRSTNETEESALEAERILSGIEAYPKQKIQLVKICIQQCSFSKGIVPDLLEAKVLQDADRLEATGAISIMRTFTSGGQMKRSLYNPKDPFRESSEPENFNFSLDLFYKRLLLVESMMYTEFARTIAQRRTDFLKSFLNELREELTEARVYPIQ